MKRLLIVLLLVSSASAWSNTVTHPWICGQGIRSIWGNATYEQYSNATVCSSYPDLGYPADGVLDNYSADKHLHHCYATCPVNSSWLDPDANETYCGDLSDCPAWTKAQEWFNLSKDTGDLYYRICYFCIGSHYLADAGDNTGRGGNPYHKMRYEDQSGCHGPLESKAETRMSNLTKWGDWSFTQECDDPPVNFTITYQDMLDTADMVADAYRETRSQEISLTPGWNLISLPLTL